MADPPLPRLEDLFHRAAELPASERQAFLARECAGEPGVAARVEALLARLDDGTALSPVTEGPGTVIGRYKLLQRIGEGGFGVVYMAEQQEPVVRKVALKIIKLGMDTREVVARLQAERQALALMDHPGIAKVLDGGATETGRPYFVMELVRGVSITEYCDQAKLSTRQRLELFADVCGAVQHAHQKGVIHRDLKPSNVLVTLHDGRPVPKVIDFGIAKAMSGRLTQATLFTGFRQFVGTPAYMSPEQAEMSGLDVDTRTDIYSLGVLLYELLTGSTPFDERALAAAGFAEIQRIIREEQPPRPSLRISTGGTAALAERRQADVPTLSRLLRGDLDWIVMKALEKERTRRYGTASELAADVRRHLADEPVLAGPPSAAYRARKFLQRNRSMVAFATLLGLALVAGFAGTTRGLLRATRAAQAAQAAGVAERLAREQEEAARRRAVSEAERAQAVTAFLVETLALADPSVALQRDLPVRTVLDRAAARVTADLAGQPRAEVAVRAVIGRAYAALGETLAAEAHLRRAVELADGLGDVPAGELYDVLWRLTAMAFTNEAPDAYALAQRARTVGHAHVGERHPALAAALDRFIAATNESDVAAANAVFPEGVRLSEEALTPGDPLWIVIANTYMHAGYSLWYTPYEADSEAYWRRAREILLRELPPSHPALNEVLTPIVGILTRKGHVQQAEALIRESLANLRAVYDDGDYSVAQARAMLGEALVAQGRYEEAEQHVLASHEVLLRVLPDPTAFMVIESYGRLLQLYTSWGRDDAARPYARELASLVARSRWLIPWNLSRRLLGPSLAGVRAPLDRLDALCGDPYTAEILPREPVGDEVLLPAVEAVSAVLADGLPHGDDDLGLVLGRHLVGWAVALPRESAPRARRGLLELALLLSRADHEGTRLERAEVLAQLAVDDAGAGEGSRARQRAEQAWELVRGYRGGDTWWTSLFQQRIGECLVRLGQHERAEALLLPSHAVLERHLGDRHAFVAGSRRRLVDLYASWGRSEDAARWQPAGG